LTPVITIKDTIESVVGGMLGFSSAKVLTQVFLEKSVYQIGETIRVVVLCDNSKC
jgi:hypothetical protein